MNFLVTNPILRDENRRDLFALFLIKYCLILSKFGGCLKTLILTEKPSVARDFAKALNISPKGEGFFESTDFVVTWAIGHLLELLEPDEYDSKWKKWNLESLPILPERLSYKANSKTKKQLSIVLKQLKRKDLDRIILATDAGREGELIGRTLINKVSPKANLYRFWTSQALSSSVIKENMNCLSPLAEYDRLYYAGRSRQSADWLVGMNLSRLATLRMGDLFSVGRVQTAVLALLVNRRNEIDNFNPEKYFTIKGKFNFKEGSFVGNWFNPSVKTQNTHIKTIEEVRLILERCHGQEAVVENVFKEVKRQSPPQLYSLTELQKDANRLFSFSAKKTLSLAQTLYEKHKCLSYPRTDSRVLGMTSFSQTEKLIEKFKVNHGDYFKSLDKQKISLKNRRVFNDAKLTDHHALIPLKESKLNGDEKRIFDLVLKRFAMVFSHDFEFEETKILTQVGSEKFKSLGQRILCLGWKELIGGDRDHFLPKVEKGEIGDVQSIKEEEKMTKPPLEYTEATLLQDMINPSRLVEEKEFKKAFRGDLGLGTQATRAQIIETLIMRKYIERKGKMLLSLPKGNILIKTLKTMKLSQVLTCPEETAKWELELEHISKGEGNPRSFMLNIRKFVSDCANEWKKSTIKAVAKSRNETSGTSKFTVIGSCPLCKNSIIESPKSYNCEKWRDGCKFTIWKKVAGKKISKVQASKILKNGSSDQLKGFKSKAGKSFNASLKIEGDGLIFIF
jgi:DNA topoisomerase III